MPSKSKKQSRLMTAACKNAEFRKKVDIPKKVACDFHSTDKGTYHKEDIDMTDIDRIKKLAGITKPVVEKVELNASDDTDSHKARASDVTQSMKMAQLKRKVEDRDSDDTDFEGLFTGVAKGEIHLDDKGKIAEATFGIIKELEENCGKRHKKKTEESSNELEEGSEEKKAGRRVAGSYGRPGSKKQKKAASKSSRKIGKNAAKADINCESDDNRSDWDKEYTTGSDPAFDGERAPCKKCGEQHAGICSLYDDINETSVMFPKGSLERTMVEIILDEMKTGKNAIEISEELAFSLDHVRVIYDHFKKKVSEGYKVVPHIDQEQYSERQGLEGPFRLLSGKIVYYDPKEGQYYDPGSDMYMSDEDYTAHNTPRDMSEDGLPGYDAWKTASPYDNEPSQDEIDKAHEYAEEVGERFLHDDELTVATVSDIKNSRLDIDDRRGMFMDLISDISGTITNYLENENMPVLNDAEIKTIATTVLNKHLAV